MNRWLITLCVTSFALPLACSVDNSLFLGDGASGLGGGDTTSGSDATSGQTTSSGQGGMSASSGQGGSGTTSTSTTSTTTSSTGTGMNNCAHDKCDEGVALMNGCDPCVTQVCNYDPFCCTQQWDTQCTFAVQQICQVDCAPGLISCEDQYNAHPSVNFTCNQSGGVCDLNASILTQSCTTICQARGGACINAFNDQMQCGHGQELGCDYVGFQEVVCVCTRGCGGNPPCSSNQKCENGVCI